MGLEDVKCPLEVPRDLISGNIEVVDTDPLVVRILTWEEISEYRNPS